MWDTFKNFHQECHERMEEMQKFGGLRIWILHVLDEHGPSNGVEVMDAIQEHQEDLELMGFGWRSRGHRPPRPSPGSIYPMLKKMVDESLIDKKEDGKYELTERGSIIVSKFAGRIHHQQRRDDGLISIEKALIEMEDYVSYLEDIKKSKLVIHKNIIQELAARLNKIEKTLREEQ